MSGINIKKFGLQPEIRKDKNGRRFIDGNNISMSVIKDNRVEVMDWVKDIETSNGAGRWALQILCFGNVGKLIINTYTIKEQMLAMERIHITRFACVFFDHGGRKYDMKNIEVLTIDDRAIIEVNEDRFKFTDTGETWKYEDWAEHCASQQK